MTDNTDSLKLVPASHGKLGIIHCGVNREGFIAVAGDPRDIADGEKSCFNASLSRTSAKAASTRLHGQAEQLIQSTGAHVCQVK